MLVCVAGDTHGELGRLYQIVDVLERQAGRAVDVVLQVGDFGVWPDPNRLDEATRRHGDSGDFRRLQAIGAVPRPTYFIAGNQRAALMGALNGRDPFDVVEDLEPDEHEPLLASWTAGGLPDPATLRPA